MSFAILLHTGEQVDGQRSHTVLIDEDEQRQLQMRSVYGRSQLPYRRRRRQHDDRR